VRPQYIEITAKNLPALLLRGCLKERWAYNILYASQIAKKLTLLANLSSPLQSSFTGTYST
jgi:hypothetical protein